MSEYLKGLSALCTCFPDPAYLQFAHIFKRRPEQNSQLQIPNDLLVEIYNFFFYFFHWNNKGNSMETLLDMLFEERQHLLF